MKFTTNNIHAIGYILSLSSIMLVSYSSKAEIFKWKDARGVIQYSDLAPSANPGKPASNQLKALLAARTMCLAEDNAKAVNTLKVFDAKTQMVSALLPESNNKTTKSNLQQANFSLTMATATQPSTTTSAMTSIIQALKVNTATVISALKTTTTTTSPITTSTTSTTILPKTTTATTSPIITATSPIITATSPIITATATATAPTNMNEGTMGMPYVNLSLAPAFATGKGFLDVRPTTDQPDNNSDATGEFRVVCLFSHMRNDDPIVYPNQAGRAHLHSFFGNTSTNSTSTPESLRASGNSTCDGGIMNRSSYWVPTMIDTRTGTPIAPTFANFYYKTLNPSAVNAPPKGLRMIAGDMKASSTQSLSKLHFWCENAGGSDYGYIPACGVGDTLIQVIKFPMCWDGKNLDSADHKSHMSYTVENSCPASHPVLIPDISFNISYKIRTGDDPSKWRLSSDMYSSTIKGGYSTHGDWMNGWSDDATTGKTFTEVFTKGCLQAGMNCGNSLTGDGRKYQF